MHKLSLFSVTLLSATSIGALDLYAQEPISGAPQQKNGLFFDEILVTATRRSVSSQDVPNSLQVFSGSELERFGATGFGDYILKTPSISLRDQGSGPNASRFAVFQTSPALILAPAHQSALSVFI